MLTSSAAAAARHPQGHNWIRQSAASAADVLAHLYGGHQMIVLKKFVTNKSGATAIEYGLIAGLISVAIIGALGASGMNLGEYYEYIGGKVAGALKS